MRNHVRSLLAGAAPKLLSALVGVSMLGLAGAASAGEPLTNDQLDIVTAGVSLTGGPAAGWTGGIGTTTQSNANSTQSQTIAQNGGSTGAAFIQTFTLAAEPPGS
jgi:hypothetical protein